MDGFLPLIEAFLAFALTMLGLATAVAALTGIWQRVFRWRAAILRESLTTLYTNRIAPLLLHHRAAHPPSEESLAEFIVEMTMLPVSYHEALPRDKARADRSAAEGERTQLSETLATHADVRARRIARVQRCLGVPEGRSMIMRQLFHMQRAWRGWLASRYAHESLPEAQFARRLADATAGHALAQTVAPAHWDKLLHDLTESYAAIGVGATEEFTRRCRVYTVACSFALVFGVNVDAFDLLNRYLTDPELRVQVIEKQAVLLSDAQSDGPDDAQPLPTTDRLQQSVAELRQEMQLLSEEVREAAPASREITALLDKVQTLQSEVGVEVDALAKAGDAVGAGVEASRAIAAELVDNFPLGWNRYPYCDASFLTDSRCLRVLAKGIALQPVAERSAWFAQVLSWTGFTDVDRQWRAFNAVVDRTWQADAGGMFKWLLGVVLAGLMAGLGAPFWVRVVNRVLEVRDAVRSRGEDTSNAPGNPAAPATPPRPVNLLGPTGAPTPEEGAATAHRAADQALGKPSGLAEPGSR